MRRSRTVTMLRVLAALVGCLCACEDRSGQGVDDWGDLGKMGGVTSNSVGGGDDRATDGQPPQPMVDGGAPTELGTMLASPDAAADRALASPDPQPPDSGPTERCPRAELLAARNRHDNLLGDGDFSAASMDGWSAEIGTTQLWNARDAEQDASSGSLAVTNGNVVPASMAVTLAAARRCIPVIGGKPYQLWAEHFLDAAQPPGSAGLAVTFSASADCSGTLIGAQTVSLSSATGSWTLQCGTITVPPAAASMLLRLLIGKSLKDPAVTALFDDVVVSPRP